MKVFIIFFGLLIINISFLVYQGDMGRYVRCQIFLKAVAEECAAGAALYFDETAYADGRLMFTYEEGKKYIEYIVEKSKGKMPLPKESIISYEVEFQDDFLGYESDSSPENSEGSGIGKDEGERNPSVTVELTVATEDLFRLPFLTVTEIIRAARYELPQ